MTKSYSRLSLTAANDAATEPTMVAVAGIVALLARSQARRLAERAAPANEDFSPSKRMDRT